MTPKVTILIPTFARTRLLAEAVWCATHQNEPVRVLVVNDCTDQTLIIDHPLVEVVNHVPYFNFGSKRDAMVRLVKTQYLTWLDDDDCCTSRFVGRMLSANYHEPNRPVWSTKTWYVNGDWWTVSQHSMELLVPAGLAQAIGYKSVDLHEELDFMAQLRLHALIECEAYPPAYIYRQGVAPALSHLGGQTFRERGLARIKAGEEPGGRVVVEPRKPELKGMPACLQGIW